MNSPVEEFNGLKTITDVTKLWRDPSHLDLQEPEIERLVIENMDKRYLLERGAKDVVRTLRYKYRRQAKMTTEQRARADEVSVKCDANIASAWSKLNSQLTSIFETVKMEGKKEAWAEMDKWIIKNKPLSMVSFEEIQAERNQDHSSAMGALANVRFYDELIAKMKPGQTVSEAMTEQDVIEIRDSVFAAA